VSSSEAGLLEPRLAFDRSQTKKATAAKQVDHQSQPISIAGRGVGDALDRAATHRDRIRAVET
jgi:hypothetical protein